MSTFDICVPAEQEGTRSQVLRWLKQPGDAVRQHEPLVELETDKVTVEVPAPADGVLREILKGEREELEPGEVLGRMETGAATGGESASAESSAIPFASGHDQNAATAVDSTKVATGLTTAAGNAARQLSPAVKRLLAEHSLDPSNVRGTGQGGRITVEDVLARRNRALFLNARAAIAIAPRVAELLARELNRDESWQRQQVQEFTAVAQGYLPRESQ